MNLPVNEIICGDAETELKKLPDEFFNCCISSPPFWALRDYGIEGQLGLEPTFEEYIDKLCTIYNEVKRVLRDDGTCWVNLGDTYAGSGGEHKPWHKSDTGFQHNGGFSKHCLDNEFTRPERGDFGRQGKTSTVSDRSHSGRCYNKTLPAKSLCLIPQRFAIEMVNRGWILRNVLIWHKPNPMPSSAKDRFTVDFEYVYFFVKNRQYFFEPQYEPNLTESNAERPRMGQGKNTIYKQKRNDYKKHTLRSVHGGNLDIDYRNPLGRNKRTVWTIPTQPFPEAHFATFPEKLVEPMILAGCPEFVCKKCGKARKKIYDIKYISTQKQPDKNLNAKQPQHPRTLEDIEKGRNCISDYRPQAMKYGRASKNPIFKGYTDCGCGQGWRPGVCLDPFCRQRDCRRGGRRIAA